MAVAVAVAVCVDLSCIFPRNSSPIFGREVPPFSKNTGIPYKFPFFVPGSCVPHSGGYIPLFSTFSQNSPGTHLSRGWIDHLNKKLSGLRLKMFSFSFLLKTTTFTRLFRPLKRTCGIKISKSELLSDRSPEHIGGTRSDWMFPLNHGSVLGKGFTPKLQEPPRSPGIPGGFPGNMQLSCDCG